VIPDKIPGDALHIKNTLPMDDIIHWQRLAGCEKLLIEEIPEAGLHQL